MKNCQFSFDHGVGGTAILYRNAERIYSSPEADTVSTGPALAKSIRNLRIFSVLKFQSGSCPYLLFGPFSGNPASSKPSMSLVMDAWCSDIPAWTVLRP